MNLKSLEVLLGLLLHSGVTLGGLWRRTAVLDSEGKFLLAWEVNETRVTFEVSAQTTGFVGFGISLGGGMKGADIVTGGVTPDSTPYFTDRHALGNAEPLEDSHQDWSLLEASENSTHTFLKFTRLLDTCDPQDVSITTDAQTFIWSFGETDDVRYHSGNRGSFIVNILDPPSPPKDTSKVGSLGTGGFGEDASTGNDVLVFPPQVACTPRKATSRWAQFGALLTSPAARRHTHHFTLNICKAPKDAEVDPDKFFQPFVTPEGQNCFLNNAKRTHPAYDFCSDLIVSWAQGARGIFLPEEVGFPFTEGTTEYFLLEIHLDNPGAKGDISFEAGAVIYHTSSLRPMEAGILVVDSPYDYSLMIPPNSTEFTVSTHCAPSCTSHFATPLTVFNAQLHAHRSAIKMRLRHFRNSTELPWISSDHNYNQQFQSIRNIRPAVEILPGDQLTLECSYKTTWSPRNAVIGGYSTSEEMCDVSLYFYPKNQVVGCGSRSISFPRTLGIDGFEPTDKPEDLDNDPVISNPPHLKGLHYRHFLDTQVNWTLELRDELQRQMRYSSQGPFCLRELTEAEMQEEMQNSQPEEAPGELIAYPQIIQVYSPPRPPCSPLT